MPRQQKFAQFCKCNLKPLEGFKQENVKVGFTFLKDYSDR